MFETIVSLLEVRANQCPDEPLFSFLDGSGDIQESLTYQSLYTSARAIATMLQERRLAGKPILLWIPRGRQFIETFYGCILSGAIPIPFAKPRSGEYRTLFRIIENSGAKSLLTTPMLAAHLPPALIADSAFSVIGLNDVDATLSSGWKRPAVTARSIAFVQYTSGSTSHPKGVVVTHRNVLHNSLRIKQDFGIGSQDIGLTWLPLFHDMGLMGHVVQPLYSRIHNFFLSPQSFIAKPRRWLEALSRHRATISGGPTFAFDACVRKVTDLTDLDLSSWRVAYCASERISQDILMQFTRMFTPIGFNGNALFAGYGLAESTSFVCGTPLRTPESLQVCDQTYFRVGEVDSSDSIIIVDPNTQRSVAAERQIGEIWLQSDSVASGYFNEPAGSTHVFDADCDRGAGYLRTGDLGFIADGGLYFVSRAKNMVKINGRSMFLEDFEAEAAGAVMNDGITRCAAVPVSLTEGEQVVLLLERENRGAAIDVDRCIASVNAEICRAFGLLVSGVRVIPAHTLPLTTSGKLQRAECLQRFRDGLYPISHVEPSG